MGEDRNDCEVDKEESCRSLDTEARTLELLTCSFRRPQPFWEPKAASEVDSVLREYSAHNAGEGTVSPSIRGSFSSMPFRADSRLLRDRFCSLSSVQSSRKVSISLMIWLEVSSLSFFSVTTLILTIGSDFSCHRLRYISRLFTVYPRRY